MQEIKTHLLITAIVSIIYASSFWLMDSVVAPVQQLLLPDITQYALLIFLPHGVRVLTAWLFGWWSVPYLMVANVFAHFLVTPDIPVTSIKLETWCVTAVAGVLGIALLRAFGVKLGNSLASIGRETWRQLIIAGIVASILSSVGHSLIYQNSILHDLIRPVFFAFVFGDTLGTLLCFALLLSGFVVAKRWIRIQ